MGSNVEVQDVELQIFEVQNVVVLNVVAVISGERFEKPYKIYEDGGLLFTNGSMQRMLNGEELYINRPIKKMSFQDFTKLLNENMK